MAMGMISLGYPGNRSHAMWSIVMAIIAMILILLEFNVLFIFAPSNSG
jgi:hypothetical protein